MRFGQSQGLFHRRRLPHWMGFTAAFIVIAVGFNSHRAFASVLENFVAEFDPAYQYSLVGSSSGPGYTSYVLDMTSQTWRSPSEVDRTEWQHYMNVVVPDNLHFSDALIFIGGGSNHNNPSPPLSPPSEIVAAALESGSVVAELRYIPNEHLTFSDEVFSRTEDEIISYTFDKALDTGDLDWPLLLPMVKSTVRAMDTIQDFIPTQMPGQQVDEFVLTGGSKRGWTTWLTGAVDDRVMAIAPAVFDLLNWEEQLPHHLMTYEDVDFLTVGGVSIAMQDYVAFDLQNRLQEPEALPLVDIVDPYRYRDDLDMPKFLMLSTGDEFFVGDSTQHFWDDLPGENNVRLYPNTGHGLDERALFDLIAWYQAQLTGSDVPEISWEIDGNGQIIVQTDGTATSVKVWEATNLDNRDFRWFNGQGQASPWTSFELSDQGDGTYIAEVDEPDSGYKSFIVELEFPNPSGGSMPLFLTTEMSVIDATPDGDVNGDGQVDGLDVNILSENWLLEGATFEQGDVTGDGVVDALDANYISSNWLGGFGASPIPEPSTFGLAMIAMLAVGVRRRSRS